MKTMIIKGALSSKPDDRILFRSPEHRLRKLEMEDTNMLEKEGKIESGDEKGSRRRRLFRAVKAVLFHIKLRRSNREKRLGSDSTMMRSSSSFSFRFRKRNHDNESSKLDFPKSASTRSTSSSSSILSPPSSSSSPRTSVSSTDQNPKHLKQGSLKKQSNLEEQSSLKEQRSVKEEGQQRQRSGPIMIGVVLILISLALTVLCGKVWAIGFNAMWLASIPRKWGLRPARRGGLGSGGGGGCVDRVKEEVRKRKVIIMEGMLDRRHHHHHQNGQQQKL